VNLSVSVINPSQIAREGLCRIINDAGLSVAAEGSCFDAVGLETGDLVLIDTPDPVEQVGAIEAICARAEGVKCIVLAEKFDYQAMVNCFGQGAQGYVVKNIPGSTLIALLNLAALGHKVVPSDLADMLLHERGPVAPEMPASGERGADQANLSNRERDVLGCLMAGFPNKLIARKLDVSEATVKVHVKAILRKLQVTNRTQAAMWAKTQGVKDPELVIRDAAA
jgi:two-component system nitrate/nitrite response regulator NarL